MPRIALPVGLVEWSLSIPDEQFRPSLSKYALPPAKSGVDVRRATREALDSPTEYPALHRALTPEDRIVIVVDEKIPHLMPILETILTYLQESEIPQEAITLLSPPGSAQEFLEELPDEFLDVHAEVHDPDLKPRLSYVASTMSGKRVYMNRTLADADQAIVLSLRGYDVRYGYSGAEAALYPAFSGEVGDKVLLKSLLLDIPDEDHWPERENAAEVVAMLGSPFLLQVIPGAGDTIQAISGGLFRTTPHGERLLDSRWKLPFSERVDTVIASISGSATSQGFPELAQALTCASRILKTDGRVILLSDITPPLTPGMEMIRAEEDISEALKRLKEMTSGDKIACWEWLMALRRIKVSLRCALPETTIEELQAASIETEAQVQSLISRSGTIAVIADAHRAMAYVRDE